jgi:hypothetical protein
MPVNYNEPIYILHDGWLKREDIDAIIGYIKIKNSNIPDKSASVYDLASVRILLETYFNETEKEAINPDLAIAQMLLHTGFFADKGIYLKNRIAHNYGALLGMFKNRFWTGNNFIDIEHGVKAHIQFLRLLAVGKLSNPETTKVYPLWDIIKEELKGTKSTLDQIAENWWGEPYKIQVKDIYNALLTYVEEKNLIWF